MMDRVYLIITVLIWIPLVVILESFDNTGGIIYGIYRILFFPLGMFFSLYLHYYFSRFEYAEELAEEGKFIAVKFFNRKRFIVSLLVCGILLVFTGIADFTVGLDFFTDLLDEDDPVPFCAFLLFLLLLYILKIFANIIYKRIQ